MKRCWLFISALLFSAQIVAAEMPAIVLETAPVNIHDTASIKRGAQFFGKICMACHTLVYMRYDKIAREAGVTYEKMPVNVAAWPFGIKPPDLSLEADVRGVDWIYTYLHSFYPDATRPTGFNNLIFPDTVMTAILAPYQGQQMLATDLKTTQRIYAHQLHWYDVLELKQQGTMTPAEFDALTIDIVNFLAYAANPYQAEQRALGVRVLGFLIIFFILAYLLKKNYWRDVK